MIGLPAIALAMLALYLLVAAQRGRRVWQTIVSGIIFGLSIQTKLFTGVLVPVVVVYFFLVRESGTSQAPLLRQRVGRCVAWLCAVGAAFVVTGLLVGTLDPQLLIASHIGGETRAAYESRNNLEYIAGRLPAHAGYLPLAAVGILWGFRRRIPEAALAFGWLAVAFASFAYQKPLFYYHFLLMAVPLAWLGGFGVEACLRLFGFSVRAPVVTTSARPRRLARRSAMVLFGGLIVFVLVSRAIRLPHELPFRTQNQNVVSRLCPDGRSKPAWVFSDRPIYSFEAGLTVPPPIAAVSSKRLASGQLTEGGLLDILKTYRPEFVVLERYLPDLSQPFIERLSADYELLQDYYDQAHVELQLMGLRPSGGGQFTGVAQVPSTVVFDDWLSLEWTLALLAGEVEAGNCLATPGLRWQRPTTQPGRALAVSARLRDKDGRIVAQYDEPLGTDYNTMRDRAQMPYFMNLLIPEGTSPGKYDLALVVYDPQTGEPLEATGAAASGDGAVLGQVRVDRPAEAVPLRRALADFGPVRLVTADTPATTVSPGGAVPLDLLWQAGPDQRGESLVVVAQLLDDQGKVVAGLEEEPLNGRYGTARWQPGELVRDHHVLSVSVGTRPGRYDLIIGLYGLPGRERLKTPAGLLGLRPQDHFPLREIEVR
jgi:hypothetical protein